MSALRESEERFRSSFDHAPIGMALVALDGRFLQVNRALCELVGYSEQELLEQVQSGHRPSGRPGGRCWRCHKRLWAGEIDTYQLEKRYIHKDGHVVWILLTGSVVRDARRSTALQHHPDSRHHGPPAPRDGSRGDARQ